MITRKDVPALAFFLLLSISLTECQNEKSYDTNDWIPIPQPAEGKDVIQKRATGRVLTLSESPQPKFFPEEFRNIRQAQYEQFLRETSSGNKQRPVQKQEKSQQQKPFTPQQLEQYYINQRKQLAQAQQLSERKVPQQQQNPTVVDGHVNPHLYQQNLLKQAFPNLPQEYLIPPQSIQQNYFPQQYVFQSSPETQVPTTGLRQTGPVQFNNPEIKQVIQQPPSVNGTVDFYNALNLGFQNANQQNYRQIELTTPINKDTIQLVYVPLEQLQQNNHPVVRENQPKPQPQIHHQPQNHHQQQNHQQPQNHNQPQNHHQQATHHQQQRPHQQQNHQVRLEQQPRVQPQTFQRPQTNSFHGQQNLIKNIQNDFIQQALHAHKLQEQFEQGGSNFQVSTQPPTRKPVTKKRKPHQPPLAVYMTGQDNPKVTDVLYALKDAKSINVQDTVGPDSPSVFVGPANLDPPNGFSKFELPYLSSLESNRVERKVDQLPFFVAPLNYKAPPGYAKIPFPAPHVGTVVINMNDLDQNQEYIDQTQEVIPSSIRVEKIEEASRRPVRTRGRPQHRVQPEVREQTTERVVEIQENPREHFRGGVSTFVPHYPEPVTQQEQFNQNRYYTSVSPEQVRDYQVQNSNYKHSNIQPTTTTQSSNQHPYKFVHVSADESVAQDHNVRSSTRPPTPKQNGGIQFDIVQSVGSTLSPYDEKKHNNFFAHFENFNQASNAPQVTEITPEEKFEEYVPPVNIAQEGLQAHDVQDVYSIIPQVNREKVLEQEVMKQKTRQYLPLEGQHKQQKGHVNYDHLFQLPFITNAEVNQINTAARPRHQEEEEKERPTTGHSNIQQEKYVVFEEYPVKQNHTTKSRPMIYNERVNVDSNRAEKNTESPTGNLLFPGLINDLEDPSIRQLLTPILLAPTEKTRYSTTETPQTQPEIPQHRSSTEYVYSYSEEPSSTTSAPVTTTTQQYKIKTRGRGNSRFNDRTTTQSPRRNAGRRTQHPSRTRHTTTSTTEYPDIVEYTTTTQAPRRVSVKQRFRTRGRPYISEGYSTTTSNSYTSTTPTTTTQEVVDDEYSHAVYPITKTYTEESVKKPQLITRAKILSPEEEYLINKYNLAYTISQDPKTDKINVEILTDREKEDSVPESDVIQSQSTPRYHTPKETVVQQQSTPEYDVPKVSDASTISYPRERDYSTVRSAHRSSTTPRTVRIKTRIRGRPKTTTPAPSTTERAVVASTPAVRKDEFYGFFRSPSFKPSSSEENEAPNGRYIDSLGSSTKHETGGGEDDDDGGIKLFVNEVGSTSGPVQFVGELLPKYSTSTEQYFEVTLEEKPVTERYVLTTTTTEVQTTKRRQRGRGQTRRTTTQSYEESSNEVQGSNEVRHRPTPRGRTRGMAHFKLPETATTELNQKDDNYPQLYLSAKENQEKYTPQTSVFPDSQTEAFRITVDPELEEQEEDQEVHSSILRPKAVLPEYNHFDDGGKQRKFAKEEDVQINGTDFRSNMTDIKITDVEDLSDIQAATEEVPANEEVPTSEEKKKGYWKLVKSKKVNDEFEAAESQNIGVVKQNSLVDEKRFATESSPPLITTEDDSTEVQTKEDQFMTVTPTNEATTIAEDDVGLGVATPQVEEATTQPTHDMLNMRNVETSTSTTIEISQKTVICTRGVCVNSPDIDMK